MKIHRIKSRSGESIVEVMVSAAVFLLLVAVLEGAILFSNAAQRKSSQIRTDSASICKALQSTPAEGNEAASYEFYAVSSGGTVGNKVFTVKPVKQKKEVKYTKTDGSEDRVTFYVYGVSGSGGGGP